MRPNILCEMHHYLHQRRFAAEGLSVDVGASLQQDGNRCQEILTGREDGKTHVRKHEKSDFRSRQKPFIPAAILASDSISTGVINELRRGPFYAGQRESGVSIVHAGSL